MWEVREPQTIIQAAEKAAEAGNFASAEHLLREAARLQEASLGPRHPDLANTLNNLGIVCEMTGKADDAEQYFRRAVSIARTSLAPDHPFVATSQKNLHDFCEARGKKVELTPPVLEVAKPAKVEPPAAARKAPPPALEVAKPVEVAPEPVKVAPKPVQEAPKLLLEAAKPVQETPKPVPEAAKPAPEAPAPALERAASPEPRAAIELEPEDPEATSRKFFGRLALGALGPISMLMVVLAIGLPRLGAPELAPPSPAIAINSQPDIVAAPAALPTPAPIEEAPAPEEPTPPPPLPPPPAIPTKSDDHAADASPNDDRPASTGARPFDAAQGRPVVVRASLCGDLDDWSCDPADRPVPPGPLFFYTQIKSPTATTVQHRWYHQGHLLQAVDLRVQASGTAGYRTYSRNVMKSDSAGNWKVEVRSKDGALLHEERFSVQ
jgi:hypothetical protein